MLDGLISKLQLIIITIYLLYAYSSKYKWIHYDEASDAASDAALYHTCRTALDQRKHFDKFLTCISNK